MTSLYDNLSRFGGGSISNYSRVDYNMSVKIIIIIAPTYSNIIPHKNSYVIDTRELYNTISRITVILCIYVIVNLYNQAICILPDNMSIAN